MQDVVETLADLVRINSVNPEWDGPGESGVAQYVRSFLGQAGADAVWEEETLPGRNNVMARVSGRDPSRSILFEAHMDTVSAEGMVFEPFDPVIVDGHMRGRGSCDVKAGLAAMMHAVAEVQEPACDVVFAAVVDEEHAYRGVTRLIESFSQSLFHRLPDAAVVAEPTELKIIRANKGVLRWEAVTRGKSVHSSMPHLGHSAITDMAHVVLTLNDHFADLTRESHELLGPATGSVGIIAGGTHVNFVPDECRIKIDRRMLPGETPEHVLERCQQALQRRLPDIFVEFLPPELSDEAMETPADSPIVLAASKVARSLGLCDVPAAVAFGCDSTKLSRAGIPSIIFGPGSIEQAHTDHESVDIDQVRAATEFYRRLLLEPITSDSTPG